MKKGMNMMRTLALATGCVVLFMSAMADTIYVSPTGDDTAPTEGFATGYASIQDAIDMGYWQSPAPGLMLRVR